MMDSVEQATVVSGTGQPPRSIEGNVDQLTGNLEVNESLVIHGDVGSGVTVRTHGSLDVEGNVEDATIEADGDVVVRHGFTGHGTGKITASGTVKVSHIHNQTIVAGKDIVVEHECINATLTAGGKIASPNAVISGGKLDASLEVEVGEIGLADEVLPKIRAGHRAKLIEHLGTLEKEMANAERQLREVKEAVYKLVKIKVDHGALSADKEALLVKLQAAQKMLPDRIASMTAERSVMNAELQKKTDARIIVHGTVPATTMVEIDGARKILDTAIQSAEFIVWSGALEVRSL
jgi:uncharacterized protein